MRSAVNAHPEISHDSLTLSDKELMKAIGGEYEFPKVYFSQIPIVRQKAALISSISSQRIKPFVAP